MMLITMVPELMAYGLVAGIAMKNIRTGRVIADLYISLGTAMVIGRIVGGIAQLLAIYILGIQSTFSIIIWINSYFIGTLPGILCQLAVIPVLVLTLMKAKVIPNRYQKVDTING
jgi:niacin transporter